MVKADHLSIGVTNSMRALEADLWIGILAEPHSNFVSMN